MSYIESKTNWTKDDFFNIADYNRISGNMIAIKELAQELFYGIDLKRYENIAVSKGYNDDIYASEFNAIESNIWLINNHTYKFTKYEIGTQKTYRSNGATPTYEDMNRIEYAIQKIYQTMIAQKDALPRLAVRLGQKGIRV